MENSTIEVTALSSKGQIVLPKAIRDELSLKEGAKLIVVTDGNNILLKPINMPDKKEFNFLMKKSEEWAKSVNLKKTDIKEAIKFVRKHK